jgi:polar amino acid transport system substrate-binding protein
MGAGKRASGLLSMVLLGAMVLLVSACGGGSGSGSGGGDGGNLLQEVKERGVLRVSTDPAYPPQSFQNESGEFEGFDIDVANEIAKRMGLETEWQTPSWDVITAGNWNGRWDVSVGSMTPTPDRQKVLHFTQPYYYTPAAVAVHEENTDITDLETDLDGKKVGVCAACTYEAYLNKALEIPGEFDYVVDDATIKTYDTDSSAVQDLAIGDGTRLDAVMSALYTLKEAEKNTPIKVVGDPVFYEPLAVSIDKEAPSDPQPLVDEIDKTLDEMHEDGTLTKLSEKWYGIDLSKKQEG